MNNNSSNNINEGPKKDLNIFPKLIIIVIFLFLIIITILVYFYYNSQKNSIKSEANHNLIAISDLKAQIISTWLNERKKDANSITTNKFLLNALYEYKNNPDNKTREKLLETFKVYNDKGFFTIRIIGSELENLITFPENNRDLGNYVKDEVKNIINSGLNKTYISDIRYYENSDSLHLDIITPIFKENSSSPFAILILEINPVDLLFKHINEWPTESKTSENLLIEKLGNEVININPVRHIKSSPFSIRTPLYEKDNISVRAINGERGLIEGIDYRGVHVIGIIKPIEETKWILISKTDEEEIYLQLKILTTWFITFLALTILITISFILLVFIKTKYTHKIHLLTLQREKEAIQKHYESIIRYANDIFILTTAGGDIIDVNEKAIETYGYTKEEMIQMNIKDLRVPELRGELDEILSRISKEKSKIIETLHIKKDNTIFPVEASIREIEIEGQLYIQSIIRDTTERKNAEKKINHLNRTYALLSKINETIVRVRDKNILLNEICKIANETGNFKAAWVGLINEKENKIQVFSSFTEPEKFQQKVEKYLSLDSNESSSEINSLKENRIIITNDIKTENKNKKWADEILKLGLKSSISLPLTHKNKVIGVLNLYSQIINYFSDAELELLTEVASDISFALTSIETELEKEKAFAELENSEQRFKTLFNNASDAMLLLDYDRIIDCNIKASEMYMLKKEELLNKKPYELSPEIQKDGTNSKEKALQYIQSAINDKPQIFEWIHLKGDNTEFEAEININKITIDNKPLLLVIVRDITKRKKFENELLRAKQKAEEMNKLKSNFLANMSHELRTPLTGIVGFAEVLYSSSIDKNQKELIEIILKGSKRLTNTLNLILDLSKIESDKIELKSESVKISSVLLDIAVLFQIAATRKNLNLKTEIFDDLYAYLDKNILEKILSNLVQNAITFTKKGEVILSLERESTLKGNYVVIKVRDTGIGIPEDKHKTVFEPFRQVSEGYDRFYEGVGLGLTITKKYTELMGGEISLNSEVGRGSTFILKFPEIKPPSELVQESEITPKNLIEKESDITQHSIQKNVLLVEDDEESIITIKYILKDICNLDTVLNGFEAISLVQKRNYKLILMDIGLKGIDGIQTTREIRKLKNYKDTPIVALTAFAMVGDKEKFLEAGCSHYLSKPFSPNDLRKLVIDILSS